MADPQLQSALSRPDIAAMSDADALVAINTPAYTARINFVTFATLTAADVWGFTKAIAFMAALRGAATPTTQAVLALLNGPGFDPSDPQATAVAGQLAAAFPTIISSDDAKLALNTVGYLAGRTYTLDEITAARAAIVRQAQIDSVREQVTGLYAAFVNEKLNPARGDTSLPAPTLDDFKAFVAGN